MHETLSFILFASHYKYNLKLTSTTIIRIPPQTYELLQHSVNRYVS